VIKSKNELKKCLTIEKKLYLPEGGTKAWIAYSKDYWIFKYQKYLRKEEFYGNNLNSLTNKLCYIWFKRKKNVLGQKLGFDIPINCFDVGLRIHHVGSVTVNSGARIGKNCDIAGNVCIGSNGGKPRIGDDCFLGYGSVIIGGIDIADKTMVGAGAVVVKSNVIEGAKLAGVPAKPI
jgi:serine O-acetyltransferase